MVELQTVDVGELQREKVSRVRGPLGSFFAQALEYLESVDMRDPSANKAVAVPQPEGMATRKGEALTVDQFRARVQSAVSYRKRAGQLGTMKISVSRVGEKVFLVRKE